MWLLDERFKEVLNVVMDIRLVRIDDRLIHGQVATVWTKLSKAERIIIISDEVARDHLRKTPASSRSTRCKGQCDSSG